MSLVAGIHHLAMPMPVGKEALAEEFYGGLLGFERVEKPVHLQSLGGAWFQMPDGRQLHLQAEPDFKRWTRPHPAFAVNDLDALAALFESKGLTAHWDDRWTGVRRFYCADPFGNRLEFVDAGDVGL